MKQIPRRLTYANVMSSLAVFLVLGGATAFAAGQLGKNTVGPKQLKKNAVTTAKIKNGAVIGAKINAATLGTVPNATHAFRADSAGSAGSADTVGGVGAAELDYRADSASGPTVVYSRSGLTISAGCVGGNIAVLATTSNADASIYTTVVDTDIDNNNLTGARASGGFEPGALFDLLAGNDGNPGIVTFVYDSNDGTTVTGTFSADERGEVPGVKCQAHGVIFNA